MDKLRFKTILIIITSLIFALFSQSAASAQEESSCRHFYSAPLWQNLKSIQKLVRVQDFNTPIFSKTTPSLEMREIVQSRLLAAFELFKLGPAGQDSVTVAINLSPKNILHIATQNATDGEAAQILNFLHKDGLLNLLAATPKWFRNKYFEINLSRSNPGRVQISSKFSWQIGVPIVSQLKTGFPYRVSHGIRPLDELKLPPNALVRHDLISQKRSQETLATCGVSSLVQVLNGKGIKVTEGDLLDKMEKMGLKTKEELFGINPGLEFHLFVRLAEALGVEYGFKTEAEVFTQHGFQQFQNSVREAAENKSDIILNYMSTEIGRPGAGHYSPIGGLSPHTGEILISETNLAMNPAFWIKANSIFRAMRTKRGETNRGYLVIKWEN